MLQMNPSPLARLKLAVVPLLLIALSACASGFNSQVTRFASQLPAPQGCTRTTWPMPGACARRA